MSTSPQSQATTAKPTPKTNPKKNSSTGALDRQLPHSERAERALLGSMLLDRDAIGEAITALGDAADQAFFFGKHQRLYALIAELYDRDRAIDGVVIRDELKRRGWFDELGGYDFLAGLASAVPSALRVHEYARIVREKRLLRQLVNATHRVMESAFDDALPAQEILDFAEREIFGVTEQRVSSGTQTLPELIKSVFEQIESHEAGVLTGEPTGFVELDDLTCGMQPAELIIVAGRPSMGKTALGLNMAEHLAIAEGRPALFFSLEMSRQQVAQRILCSRARVDAHKLRRGRHSARDLEKLHAAADQISSAPLFVDDTSHLSILELRARARMAYRKHGIRALFVDYLQLMHAPGYESRQVEVAEISRGLKALAKELKLPVVAMAQLNRNSEDRSRQGNRPRMSDLRESGAIEQDADVVALLHREAYYAKGEPEVEEDNTAELIIAKQRNGPVGTVTLHFNKQWTRFDNHKPGGAELSYVPEYSEDTDFP
ncbi:MAG: replicative DNA helicase [Planctomycetes bacterium]|nr:replicative DNA helicase [Planctomycetota bacterium]